MTAKIKGYRFEGNELIVDIEVHISFGLGTELPEPAKQAKAGDYVDAQREKKRAYCKAWYEKKQAGKAKGDYVSDEKLATMQKLQDQIKQLQEETNHALPERA